jgi:hypothetical protein
MLSASNPGENKYPVNYLIHQRADDKDSAFVHRLASHKLSVASARFQGPTVALMEILRSYEEMAGKK